MWEEFLNASLRDNLMLIGTLIGSLGGLSFFLSIGWLRRARNSSQTILALEDENKTFRRDYASAQVRLDKVDPDIVGPNLQGQTRLPALQDRAKLARTYQDLHQGTTVAAALTLARQSVFEYSADPDRAIATARHQLALATLLDPENPEIARLTDAVDRLAALPDKAQVIWQPEVFTLSDPDLQDLVHSAHRQGRHDEALFLAHLCVEKAEQGTGTKSDNFAAALSTLGLMLSYAGKHAEALAIHEKYMAIYGELRAGKRTPQSLTLDVHKAIFLQRAGKPAEALDYLVKHEAEISDELGTDLNAAMVYCLEKRAQIRRQLGDERAAQKDETRAQKIEAYLKSAGHPSLQLLAASLDRA